MDADKAPVGALGELKPGQLFKKYKNNLWYPVRIADSDFNQALCYAIIWREHGLDLDQVHQRLGLADASS